MNAVTEHPDVQRLIKEVVKLQIEKKRLYVRKPERRKKMSKTCPNCVHGQQSKENEEKIECHFPAPQSLHGTRAEWPLMEYDEWCEEFYRKG